VFYGAWWCPPLFVSGRICFFFFFRTKPRNRLPYVECAGDEAGRKRALAAAVKALPHWVLDGETKEGVLTIEETQVGWLQRRFTP